MVYLYPKFKHEFSWNAAPLNRLLEGMFCFCLGERISANNCSYTDARLGSISFVGG